MDATPKKTTHKVLTVILLVILCVFALGAISFSLFTLFSGFVQTKPVSQAQARGMFTVFANRDIHEVVALRFPQRVKGGTLWRVADIDFKNDNMAEVEATDGINTARFEFIFAIEGSNVRVLQITDVTSRELEDAHIALIRYLSALQNGDYAAAAIYYGGSISRLIPYGNGTTDIASLLKGYCEDVGPGNRCLKFNIIDKIRDAGTSAYKFNVTYYLPNGQLYTVDDATGVFRAIVEPRDGTYYVLTLPFD